MEIVQNAHIFLKNRKKLYVLYKKTIFRVKVGTFGKEKEYSILSSIRSEKNGREIL